MDLTVHARSIHHCHARSWVTFSSWPDRLLSKREVTTAVRLPESLHTRLHETADERDVSVNLIVTKAVTEFLERLAPVEASLALSEAV